ncbi:hypothetical protein T11_11107 [Trichinella zimbabwensis]|uniref:Uncharacterized protein n=1 Tax=Trichinella zimbabwensis TaxID=268475 RepID=A0A0V1GEW9_9BILA|nr:hypothetical protein T11_11107 [Trichinella zimbabwensis]
MLYSMIVRGYIKCIIFLERGRYVGVRRIFNKRFLEIQERWKPATCFN